MEIKIKVRSIQINPMIKGIRYQMPGKVPELTIKGMLNAAIAEANLPTLLNLKRK